MSQPTAGCSLRDASLPELWAHEPPGEPVVDTPWSSFTPHVAVNALALNSRKEDCVSKARDSGCWREAGIRIFSLSLAKSFKKSSLPRGRHIVNVTLSTCHLELYAANTTRIRDVAVHRAVRRSDTKVCVRAHAPTSEPVAEPASSMRGVTLQPSSKPADAAGDSPLHTKTKRGDSLHSFVGLKLVHIASNTRQHCKLQRPNKKPGWSRRRN